MRRLRRARSKGTVVDAANDEPLIGVSVTAGTNYGVSTDIDGKFVLQVPASATHLKVSYVGYKTADVKIGSKRYDYTPTCRL